MEKAFGIGTALAMLLLAGKALGPQVEFLPLGGSSINQSAGLIFGSVAIHYLYKSVFDRTKDKKTTPGIGT